jgi:hypothetical protein
MTDSPEKKNTAPFAAQRPEKPDEPGTVSVIIMRRNGRQHVKGALMRVVTVKDAKVSDVHGVVFRALFGTDPK